MSKNRKNIVKSNKKWTEYISLKCVLRMENQKQPEFNKKNKSVNQ